MKKLVLALSLCATSILLAQQTQKAEALDSVMITTKINIPKKNSGKVVTTITREQLKNKQGQSGRDNTTKHTYENVLQVKQEVGSLDILAIIVILKQKLKIIKRHKHNKHEGFYMFCDL